MLVAVVLEPPMELKLSSLAASDSYYFVEDSTILQGSFVEDSSFSCSSFNFSTSTFSSTNIDLDRFWATSAACASLVLSFCATSFLNFSSVYGVFALFHT